MLKNCDYYDDIWGDPCERGQSLPLDFIQVLIHQHAKTLVALKSLQSEVTSLKNSSLPQPLRKKPTPKIPFDSGIFSNNSGDELYSLLSQIETKLTTIKSKSQQTQIKKPLGYLDSLLGNDNFDFKKFKNIDKNLIKNILECDDKEELKRQLLFCVAKSGNLIKGESNLSDKREKGLIKSLNSLGSNKSGRSLIPVAVKRVKKSNLSNINSNINSGNNLGGNTKSGGGHLSGGNINNLANLSSANLSNSKKFLFSQWFN